MRIAVVGAGIIGMSTAFHLKQVIPSADVSVYAKDFSPNLTSDGAAGFVRVNYSIKNPVEKIHQWTNATIEYVLEEIRTDPNSGVNGLSLHYGYELSSEPNLKLAQWGSQSSLDFHEASKQDLASKFPDNVKFGYHWQLPVVECRRYIPVLTKRFLDMGGRVFKRELKSFGELYDECDVLVNCTGLGSRTLVNDHEIYPVRGQIIMVHAPWIKEFCCFGPTYIYPNQNYIVLGGTSQENDWNLQLNEKDRASILERTAKLYPSLKKAKIVGEWVGLRPKRLFVRVEKEPLKVKTNSGEEKTMKVVHNYGHGSNGVSLHRGCAIDAVRLVQQFIGEMTSRL